MMLSLIAMLAADLPDPTPPEQAYGTGLIQCVAHTSGAGSIIEARREELADTGLHLLNRAPDMLASTETHPVYGFAKFAILNPTEGLVVIAGYDTGVCLVYGVGVDEKPIQDRLDELFSIPGAWIESDIEQLPGARWTAYDFPQQDGSKLRAETSVREMPGDKVFFMTTVTRTAHSEGR
ncbi:MAG: hypothetical protein WA985_03000 [Erythrobacter sp.]